MADTLSIQEIIERAIQFEEESVQLYANAALVAKDGHVRARLEEMAAEERGHAEKLRQLLNTNIRWAIRKSRVERGNIPDLQLAETLRPRHLGPDSDAQDVLVVAMHREKAAYDFYRAMAGLVDDPTARGLFELLATEEQQHKYRIESTYEKAVYKAF